MSPLRALLLATFFATLPAAAVDQVPATCAETFFHGGGLNRCGCHFNRKTGECHCHRSRGCGCECQPASCGGA